MVVIGAGVIGVELVSTAVALVLASWTWKELLVSCWILPTAL